MKILTIKYNPITGAQMTEEEIFPTTVQHNAQEQKARRAAHKANKQKKEIHAKRIHSIQIKQK